MKKGRCVYHVYIPSRLAAVPFGRAQTARESLGRGRLQLRGRPGSGEGREQRGQTVLAIITTTGHIMTMGYGIEYRRAAARYLGGGNQ